MQAGKLNRRVTILRKSGARSPSGQPLPDSWTELGKAWASIAFASGLQTIKGDGEVSLARASIRLRYRADVLAGMRVQHGLITYQIHAVLPDERGREYVDLVCEVIA
ncbi:phage head closure protein [Paraburkholderia unamae]|uniref:SPP1 family predicted phage head-tail adaptor n=1 Tax=Paraburkholderia unamae TaxID=219649 RepID=A0ABX5KVE7_9BURK|nr:phage head closure protein [Paraburkholderia unamae]PVX86476.1 SPP1 family predicted phage head-tail adaptor [Paraburkholderia unamae]